MTAKQIKKKKFDKVVDESFYIKEKNGGGQVKIEAWQNSEGEIVKYSIAYINHLICPADNGRVLGYDNSHGYHHKHYMGEMIETENFSTYQELVERFEEELTEFIKR